MADEAVFSRYIPEDVISNILLRLPVRSLLVCTAVSKPWNSFIKSPAFFSSHLKHTISDRKAKDSDLCLLQLCSVPIDTGTDSLFLRSKDPELSEYDRIHFPFPPDRLGYQVVASCNGLVYVMHGRFSMNSYSCEWMLWNPAIRKTLVITEHQNAKALEAVGLGFDSKTGDYKVVSIVEEPWRNDNLRVNLYSLKANSWKRLPDLDFVNINDMSVYREMAFVNGVLHFIGLQAHYKEPRLLILGFDVADEIFNQIMLPDCLANDFSDRFVSKCGESLSVLWFKERRNSKMEIWVMKEYGVEESWTKVSTVSLDGSLFGLSISGVVFKDDSHVLFGLSSYTYKDTVGRIFSHDLQSEETKEIETGGKSSCYYLGNYVESLVLLDEATYERPAEIERGVTFMDGFLENRGLHVEPNGKLSEVDPLSALFLGFLEKAGLPVPEYEQPFEVESDDGSDASASSSSYGVGSLYDHGDLGDEETADPEGDSGESDSSLHASDA